MYFMKKLLSNQDGSRDLITVVAIAHVHANKTLVLNVLKNIMDKYIEYKREFDSNKVLQDSCPKQNWGIQIIHESNNKI